jgi:hypothetical protein
VDFGAGVFTGSSNWLQVLVRTNGTAVFSPLSPREQVTPTPYAIFAESGNAAGLTGTLLPAQLPALVVTNGGTGTNLTGVALLAGGNNFTGNQTVNGTVQVNGPELITGASGVGFHADETIGPNTYFSGEEHGLTYTYTGGGGGTIGSMIMGWSGVGYFSVGNLYGSGNGTKTFTVFGNGNVNVDPTGMNSGLFNNGNTNSSGLTFGAGSGEGLASKRTAGGNQFGLDFYTSFASRMSLDNSGNLLMNSDTESIRFPATTNASNVPMIEMFSSGTQNADRMVIAHSPSYPNWGLQYQDSSDVFNFLSGGTPVLSVELGSRDTRLDGYPLYLESSTSGSYALDGLTWGDGGLAGINLGTSSPFLAGYWGGALGALSPNVVALSWDSAGDCSVSNNLSVGSLTVRGEYLVVNGLTPVYAYIGDDGSGNDVQVGSQRSGITALAAYNTADGAYMHFYCSSITIEGGADLAEPFTITASQNDVPQGAVVVIDEQNPGHLKLSDQSYDTRVAGVVSGANGINPGIQMQQQGLLEGGKNVALTGRVYVQADTSNGAIKPGDLLTTSTTPGHAMKVTDHARAAGAILGKAMTGLSGGNGMVLVLVTLQ